MAKVQFDEQIALRYDEDSGFMYRPDVLNPTEVRPDAANFVLQLVDSV